MHEISHDRSDQRCRELWCLMTSVQSSIEVGPGEETLGLRIRTTDR